MLKKIAGLTVLAALAVPAVALHADTPTISLVWRGDAGTINALQQIVDDWGAKHNAKVKVIAGAGDWDAYYNGFATKVAGGAEVDVAMLDMQAIGLGNDGVFIDLTPYIQRDGVAKDVPPISIQAYTVHGKIYGFPTALFPNIIYYNQDIFDKFGLALPPSDWNAGGWTWNDFAADAKALTLTDASGKRTQWGSKSLGARSTSIIQAFGGQLITPEGFDITDPDTLGALNFLHGLLVDDKIEPQSDEHPPGGWNPFPSGNIGMQYTGTWESAHMKTSKFKWNVGITPKAVKRTSEVTINALGIGATSKYKDLDWQLIKYLTTDPQGQTLWAQRVSTGVPATQRGQIEYLQQQQTLFPNMHAQVAVEALKYAVLDPFRLTVDFSKLADVRAKTLDAALAGTVPLKAALTQLKQLGDPLLAAGK